METVTAGEMPVNRGGASPELRVFAEAVVTHLAGRPAGPDTSALAQFVNSVLAGIVDGDPSAIDHLTSDAPLLASFFQNADLLPDSGPAAARIASAVMEAMDRIQQCADEGR